MSDDLSDFDAVCAGCESYPGACPDHDVPSVEDEIPLPPEPDDEGEEFDPPPRSADEIAAMMARHAAARRVHVATPRTFTRWSMGGFDPRARHVGCDGDEYGAGGCGRPPGQPCVHPRRGEIVGYVHPTRLARERGLFGMD